MDDVRKRYALFAGQADEGFQSRFITGFTQRAFEQDMDVCVFSMYRKYQDTPEREAGDSNIFNLANPSFFDGIVILKDSIQTAGVAQRLEENLKKSYSGPVLIADADSDLYPSVHIDGYGSTRMLTDHIISVHGKKDIAFLNGKKWHRHSKERLAGFMDEMKEHGLSVPEQRLIEGDFWYDSGERCVNYLTTDDKKLPEAIICANDQMAIGVCKALEEKGIRVTEDIIVAGADSSFEGQTSPKSITSYLAPAGELGRYSADCLAILKEGGQVKPFSGTSRLLAGESCGCCSPEMPSFGLKRTQWDTDISAEGYASVNNTMFENLMVQSDIQDYVSTVYSYAYQLKSAESFHLCLCTNVRYMGQGDATLPGHDGYPAKMIYAIRYNKNHISNMTGLDATFETDKMLPDLYRRSDAPRLFFFSPVYFEDKNFGYAAVCFGNTACTYDDIYRRWMGTISRGFESLRREMTARGLKDLLDKTQGGKFAKTVTVYESLSSEEKLDYKTVKNILDKNLLTYHFQPIVSAVDGTIYSYEALMRSNTDRRVSPLTIIKYAAMMDRLTDVETATFTNVMDILDDSAVPNAKIFVNSIPGVKVDNRETILDRLSAKSDIIVVELTEEAELGDEQLLSLKEFFRQIDIEIAVDDYGTGYSNISNLIRYMPDYVKIDRSLLSDIHKQPQKQHFVREIIEFCHDNNIKALAEGVETADELRTVIHLGADLIQGYYTAKPAEGFLNRLSADVVGQIKAFQQEKRDGKARHSYIAGKTNRVSLLTLVKEECTDIIIGHGEMVYKDITIVGTPSLKTDIHMTIEPGYTGRITLENVCFSNVKERPCIELGEGSDVICIIEGDNVFNGCGIRVPESARFCLEGSGNLLITPNHSDYYGIGNDSSLRHGDLLIRQSGKLTVTARGSAGTCIGSGAGGRINIEGGLFLFQANGDMCVAVGSVNGNNDELILHNCGMEIEMSVSEGVGTGSLKGDTKIHIQKSYVKYTLNGNSIIGIGTLSGDTAQVNITDALTELNIRSADSTCIGALNGRTDLISSIATIRMENAGEKALALGGLGSETTAQLSGVDTKVILHNSTGLYTNAPDDAITIVNGRCRIQVNNKEIEKNLIYKF